MDGQALTLPLAFAAGLLSFASPCVLPLVPAYLGYLGGQTVAGAAGRRRTFLHALLFVLGFGLVFVLLGASATFVGRLLLHYSLALQRVGGVLLVAFGLRLIGPGWGRGRWAAAGLAVGLATFLLSSRLLGGGGELGRSAAEGVMMALFAVAGARWAAPQLAVLALGAGLLNYLSGLDLPAPNLVASLLIALITALIQGSDLVYRERRLELGAEPAPGPGAAARGGAPAALREAGRSLLFGIVFAAGWTPCIGPILAGILVVAGTLDTVGQGMALLAAYALGLGLPFLAMGLALEPLAARLRRANRHLGLVSLLSGGLLILMGLLIFTGSLAGLAGYGEWFTLGG